MVKITATKMPASDLQPGDLFSTAGPEYWNRAMWRGSVGESVFIRTNIPSSNAPDAALEIFKITITNTDNGHADA